MFGLWLIAVAWSGGPDAGVQDSRPAGTLTLADGPTLVGLLGEPARSESGDRVVVSRLAPTGTELVLYERTPRGWSEGRVLVSEGDPDRPALDPAGKRLAYVAGPVAGLWLLDLDSSERTRLTNHEVDHLPGQPPAGFIAVPHRSPPVFEGDSLVWVAPDGPHRMELP